MNISQIQKKINNHPLPEDVVRKKRNRMSNHPLPEDVVRDILSRLSVKTLCRCKLVCKEWCALIQRPDFVKQHFCHESNRDRLLMRRFSIDADDIAADKMIGNKYFLNVDETFSKFEEPPHLQMPSAHLFGPLNGVYWVVSYRWPSTPAGLLNPATRQFKPLPSLGLTGSSGANYFDFGLGLDPVTGDFKLVLMSFYYKFAAVCTSDDDYQSWRFLDGVKPRGSIFSCRGANAYLNGVFYWLMNYNDCVDVVVVSFDMRTEEFKEIKVMSCDENKWGWGLLAENGDSMVLALEGVDRRSISMWKMLQEGCWIRSATMVLPDIICKTLPHYFWKDDELLLRAWKGMNEYLIAYDVCDKKLRGPMIARNHKYYSKRFYGYFKYKESLVSLKGKRGKENCMLWDPTTSDYIKPFFR